MSNQTDHIPNQGLFSDAGLAMLAAHDAQRLEPIAKAAIPWEREMMEIFLRNQLKLAFALPMIAFMLSMTALLWNGFGIVLCWMVGVVGSNLIQLFLCKYYFVEERSKRQQTEWIGMIAASELMMGIFWVLPLFTFWPSGNGPQGPFLITALAVVIALRFLIVNNFMPVLVAGTGIMTIGVATRCLLEFDPLYLSLAVILITLEVLFLFISRQLQETARDMLIFRGQKDILIEELRNARDTAEDQKQKAEKANTAKSTFLANMSHELRTPLNAILGFSEIMRSEILGPHENPTYKEYANDIHQSGQHLLNLINEILDISRIEAGRYELHEGPLALADVVEDCQRLMRLRAENKGLKIVEAFEPDLAQLWADERAIRQICLNLLSNAIKFTPTGGTITLTVARTPTGGQSLSVRDTGPGIPEHEIPRVMKSFGQGSLAHQTAEGGTGLGLPITKGLTELHNGSFELKSKLRYGTEVIVTFPRKRVMEALPRLLEPGEIEPEKPRAWRMGARR